MTEIGNIAVVGTGVIGAGWATRCLARGIDVVATDPGPDAEAKLRASLENARPAAEKLYGSANVAPGTLTFVGSVEEAVADADYIQESAPEREDLKRKLHARMDAAARPDVIIASSSSGLMPTAIQADCKHPERVLIGHPFNPVYLLPLCEVVGGEKTSADNIQRAMAFYRSIGMYALHVRKEIEGYLSDRLQEAIWREILHLVNDGVATTGELDDAIKYGPGLRWAIMGTNLIFHMAGGDTRHGPETDLDKAGSAGTDRGTDRPHGRGHPGTGRGQDGQGAGATARQLPYRHHAHPAEIRDRLGQGAGQG
jgi:carnitine 3-dehydrogenase